MLGWKGSGLSFAPWFWLSPLVLLPCINSRLFFHNFIIQLSRQPKIQHHIIRTSNILQGREKYYEEPLEIQREAQLHAYQEARLVWLWLSHPEWPGETQRKPERKQMWARSSGHNLAEADNKAEIGKKGPGPAVSPHSDTLNKRGACSGLPATASPFLRVQGSRAREEPRTTGRSPPCSHPVPPVPSGCHSEILGGGEAFPWHSGAWAFS